ncbi:MAG: hypothetical protein NTY64_14880, partial [Deltaproteobacteria bacterium]|nr:hypothetical protein [Deltaproteobacteria bacterium]
FLDPNNLLDNMRLWLGSQGSIILEHCITSCFGAMQARSFSMMMRIGLGFIFLPKKESSGLGTISMHFA